MLLGKTLPDVIKIFNKLLQTVENQVNETTLHQYSDYIFSSFMTHYKLYQYVFSNDQEFFGLNLELPVETPTEAAPFSQAIDVDVYEYEKQFEQIVAKEQQLQEQRNKLSEATKTEDLNNYQKAVHDVNHTEPPLDREVGQHKTVLWC